MQRIKHLARRRRLLLLLLLLLLGGGSWWVFAPRPASQAADLAAARARWKWHWGWNAYRTCGYGLSRNSTR
jgi:hypothetical protein